MSGNTFLGSRGPIDFRGGPHAGVAPSSNGFGGGALNRASRPTDVQGGFSLVKAGANTPTNVTASGIVEARNNRGSNIRIPYARLTPMHARDQLEVDDDRVPIRRGRRMAYEYDGLEGGELAWIMSKNFKPPSSSSGAPLLTLASALQYHSLVSSHTVEVPSPLLVATDDKFDSGGDGSLMNQEGALNGFGVDRMQRLAYTNWVEAFFRQRLGRQWIDLAAVDLGDPMMRALDSTLEDYRLIITGASLFAVPDVTYALEYRPYDATAVPVSADIKYYEGQTMQALPQGLFIMEQGPFLRSMGASTEASTIRVPYADPERVPPEDVAADMTKSDVFRDTPMSMFVERNASRHMGGELAQKGLYALLKKHGVFNWTPDGIVLSKLETGPSPDADAELDARQGQMFNVAIQGPAITKTWTGDPKMVCQPMDRVFVLVVGDIDYQLTSANGREKAVVDDGRLSDEATLLACKQVSNAFRAVMRPGTTFPDASNARNEDFSSTESGNGFSLSVDTREPRKNKINLHIGGASAAARSLRGWLAYMRGDDGPAARRKAKTESTKRTELYETWKQFTIRATIFEQKHRLGPTSAEVKEWYDNDRPFERDHNKGDDTDPETGTSVTRSTHMGVKQLLQRLETMLKGFVDKKTPTESRKAAFSPAFYGMQKSVLTGDVTVGSATLVNLRLMRCTSAYLSQYAYPEASNPHSRLGLNITFNPNPDGEKVGSGLTSFVLGGWCVGTVLDSAASRSMQGPMVRVAPQSMAMNVNVNVEWWSANDLHRQYGDPRSWDVGTYGSSGETRLPTVRTRTETRVEMDEKREGRDASLGNESAGSLRVGLARSSIQDAGDAGDKVPRYIAPADDVAPDSDAGRENANNGNTVAPAPTGWVTAR